MKRIKTLKELHGAALKKNAVVAPKVVWMNQPRAAAFVINFTGPTLLRLFNDGLYIYKKEGAKK